MKKFFFYFPNHQHRKTPWIKDVKLDNWKKQNFNSALEISILYTYFVLKNYGFNCELVSKLPKKGIVFVNNKAMRKIPSFNPNLFLINMQVDKTRYIFADLHVVFNQALSCELDKAFNTSYLEPSFYIPHWVSDKIIKISIRLLHQKYVLLDFSLFSQHHFVIYQEILSTPYPHFQ